ncbi:MAG: hypothetical protein RIB98_17960 [Acidimicrobiales bacterium]
MTIRLAAALAVVALCGVACGDDSADAPESATTTAAVDDVTSTTATSTTTPTATLESTAQDATTTSSPALVDPLGVGGCAADPAETRTFVDDTRVTPATAQSDEIDSRTLDVWIDRPAGTTGVPLVIFAHGLTGHPRSHEMHRQSLAEDCFLVVAPAFPLTNNDVPGAVANSGDVNAQMVDVSFLIDEVLADPELGPLVDPERIGVIGHSLGGLTTAGAAVSPEGDPRVDAAVVMSAGFGQARDDISVMVLHGDSDPVVPYASGDGSYDLLTGRRMLVTLLGGDHNTGILDDDSDLGVLVRGLTGAFFVHEFSGEPMPAGVFDELPLDAVDVEAGTADGALDDWRDYFAA